MATATDITKQEAQEDKRPEGIGFYNIQSGETLYAKTEPQIQGFINSSDLGINASRGQDFKWRIHPEWVKAIRAFRANEAKMSLLMANNSGQPPSDPQVLYAIYGEQLRQYEQKQEDNSTPYEEEYLKAISRNPSKT